MGTGESKDTAVVKTTIVDRLNERYEGISEEIRGLRPARVLDKEDLQAMIQRLEQIHTNMESDIELLLQHCVLSVQKDITFPMEQVQAPL